ncbi:ribosome-binding protein 1a isoform X2 [Pseudoliparis swirei]|uniref:ribosome-binding protein 1a isoform X2 n=1 Tax=Pseudoliparis swirei TaxID=2059687 RepID=UPI0024BE784B|nr:ribosome-binding protein 1a isoform X2 [Pseudoliparis swirei]
MDIYDPQTLGVMVFGGFMVVSALGIALVSTFSMKETSYEEALAKQRRELGKIQSTRSDKKKKDKATEKKTRGKKREEKPNGKIPQCEEIQEEVEDETIIESAAAPVVAAAPAPEPVADLDVEPTAAPVTVELKNATQPSPALTEPSPAPSPKEKKKKKVAKVEPAVSHTAPLVAASAPVKSSTVPASTKAPMSAPTKATAPSSESAPVPAKSAPVPAKSAPVPAKSAPAPAKSAPVPAKPAPAMSAPAPAKSAPAPANSAPAPAKSAPAPAKSAPAPAKSAPAPANSAPAPAKSAPAPAKSAPAPAKSAPAPAKSAPAPAKSAPAPAKSAPAPAKSAPAPAKSAPAPANSAPAPAKSAPAPAKSAPAPAKSAPAPAKSSPASSKSAPVLEAVTKDVPVMAVPPVGSQQTSAVAAKVQEPKKKASKKKTEPVTVVDSADAPLYLPYKALVSTISSMVFSEVEAHRLIEILSEKVGIIQDTWHKATQKGDPVAMLKKQLEEREKQLAAEQEDASVAKNRLRELTKELSAEKSKVASVETRLSSQLSKREQEMIALQARMQASYEDHVAQTQGSNAKIVSLQDQLEKGPNAQLARLQQENSILRDALNQATSQAESKQNAELAKLHQECTKLTKELGEKTEGLVADEHIRKGLEAKLSATEKQLSLLQASHGESEQALQRRMEEVCEELRATQSQNGSLQATLDNAQQDSSALSEYQVRIGRLEADISERSAQVEALTAQLEETQTEKSQLVQQVASINSLLEANQTKVEEDKDQVNAAEAEELKLSLQERTNQLNTFHEELKQLQLKQEAAENTIGELEERNKSEDVALITSLQDELKNLKEEVEQLNNTAHTVASTELELLQKSLTEKDVLVSSLQEELREEREKMATDASVTAELSALQSETKETLQTLFPQIPVEMEQSNWLQVFTQKAQETLSQQSQESSTVLPELLGKLKEAEDSHGSLQAECEQYRIVLAETEGMLKHLQNSVEEEEVVWKSKMANSEEQLSVALEKVSKLEAEHQSVEQLKEQMMLLEAQLEKQSDNQETSEEVEQEHAQVREQLGGITMQDQREQNGPAEAQPSQFQNESSQTTEKLHGEVAQRQQLSEEFEQAQKTITELQAQLDLLNVSAESPQADTEDVPQLQERLEKEKKLSKDLGQAATKLQQLLKATQEQLTKERDTVRTLQEHLEGKEESVELKEGTSV